MSKLCLFVCLVAATGVIAQSEYVCNDHGIAEYSCEQLLKFYGSRDPLCKFHSYECCKTCSKWCNSNWGLKTTWKSFSCNELVRKWGYENACRLFSRNCCITCKNKEINT